ncbi:MAG: RdgB/HAM1 family non-canonical purine NTP pyrophosphatase [Pyrinomonadaceae bacterium]
MTEITKPNLLIATSNRGKVKEIAASLGDLPLSLRFTDEYPDTSTPDESGRSYSENAIIKARSYAKRTGLCALADDSGLEVDRLDGAPGLRSARFGGNRATDEDRIGLLLADLARTRDQGRRARFVCVMVIVDPNLTTLNLAEGICEGRIADMPAGSGGFGYDPIFIPYGYQLTFAELPVEVKNKISHRAQALAATREFLTHLFTVA